MSEVDAVFAIALCFALAFSVGHRRAWGWLLSAAASYIVSTIYWRSGQPYGAFIAGMCDALVCLAVYFFAALKWEMAVYRLFQLAVGVNFYYLGVTLGIFPSLSHNDYAVILEIINWLALLLIGGSGALQVAGATDAPDAVSRPWYSVHRLVLSLYGTRKAPAFHKVPR